VARERELRVQILGDPTSARKAFNEVERGGDQMAGKFDKWGKGATALFQGAIAAGAFSAGKALFDHGAKLEQMQQKAEIVFGDQIRLVDAWAKANANAMGLTRREAVGLATNLADLLIPMGMSRDAAADLATRVVGLSGALSAWSNGQHSATEVADILTAAMLGERDALKSLGISIDAAEVEAVLLAKGQGELTGQLRQQAEALATVELLLAKSTDAQKAFGDETKTTTERMNEQNAKFRELKDSASEFFTKTANAFSRWWLDWLVPEFDKGMTAMERDLRKFGEGIDRWVIKPLGRVIDWVQKALGWLGKLMEQFGRLGRFNPMGPGSALTSEPEVQRVQNRVGSVADAISTSSVTNVYVAGSVVTETELTDAVTTAQRTSTRTSSLIGVI
jgi:hypothetical protein